MGRGHFPLQYLRRYQMKIDKFRRSDKVEDYRDTMKPVLPPELDEFATSIVEQQKITNSTLADDLGGGEILPKKDH